MLRNCDPLLFSRQQINFNFDSFSLLLALAYTNIKTYRSELFAYKLNLMTSIPILLKRQLPMSLVSKDSLSTILNLVANEQVISQDRLSLAIPTTEILSYYEAELLKDAVTIREGLLTLAIPLASRQSPFTVFQAFPIPMPQPERDIALQWKTEAPFLANSEDEMESTPVTKDQLDNCIGSSRYQICHENVATQMRHASSLSILYFKGTIGAIYHPTKVTP